MVGGVLTLTEVGRQDSGQYICNATNIHGYSEAYTQVEVESEWKTQMVNTDVQIRTVYRCFRLMHKYTNSLRIWQMVQMCNNEQNSGERDSSEVDN